MSEKKTVREIKKALVGVALEAWLSDKHGDVNNLDGDFQAFCGGTNKGKRAKYIAAVNPFAISEILSTIESLQRENEESRELARAFEAEANQLRDVSIANRHRADRAEAELKRLEEWRPISDADKSIVHQHHFPTVNITLRNSERSPFAQ